MTDPGFPPGSANSPGGHQHMILPNVPENCMKSKEFGCWGSMSLHPPLDPPMLGVHLTPLKYVKPRPRGKTVSFNLDDLRYDMTREGRLENFGTFNYENWQNITEIICQVK